MLAMIGNRVINLDHVRDIEPILEAELPPGYGPEVQVTFTSGATFDGACNEHELRDFRGLCGVIVPAPPGLVMVELEPVHGEVSGDFVSSPILAFRIEGCGAPVPIAVKGEPWPSNAVAVLYPDGTCESNGTTFASLDAWKAIFKPKPAGEAVEPGSKEDHGAEPQPDAEPKPARH